MELHQVPHRRDGEPVKRYAPTTTPEDIDSDIEALVKGDYRNTGKRIRSAPGNPLSRCWRKKRQPKPTVSTMRPMATRIQSTVLLVAMRPAIPVFLPISAAKA